MIDNNEIMEAQLLSGTGSLNLTHLTSADDVDAVLNFADVAATIDVVWLHTVPQNF